MKSLNTAFSFAPPSILSLTIDQKAVENHVNGAVWAFDYDKMFCVLMENEICRKVCEKNKSNSCDESDGTVLCFKDLKTKKVVGEK